MNLKKAIEIIQKDIDNEDVEWNSPLGEAYKLSFEALKAVIALRNKKPTKIWELFPGETKD